MADKVREGRRPTLLAGCMAVALVVLALAAAPFAILHPSLGTGTAPDPVGGRSATPPISKGPQGSITNRTPIPVASHTYAKTSVQVPSSIDATGASEVSSQLTSFIEKAPNGATIDFPAGATYRIEKPVIVEQREDLTFDGHGATLKSTTPPAARRTRDQLRIHGGSNITIQDLTIVGAEQGVATYYPTQQWDAGISILGADHVTVTNVRVSNTYGDCFYISSYAESTDWSHFIKVMNSTCTRAGRQGISIISGTDIDIRGNTFEAGALWALDVEPDHGLPVAGASNIVFDSNLIIGTAIASARGMGPIDHLSVTHNEVRGMALIAWIGSAKSGYRDSYITISDNTSDTAADGPIMLFQSLDNVTVSGNHQILWTGDLVSQTDCANVTVS